MAAVSMSVTMMSAVTRLEDTGFTKLSRPALKGGKRERRFKVAGSLLIFCCVFVSSVSAQVLFQFEVLSEQVQFKYLDVFLPRPAVERAGQNAFCRRHQARCCFSSKLTIVLQSQTCQARTNKYASMKVCILGINKRPISPYRQ